MSTRADEELPSLKTSPISGMVPHKTFCKPMLTSPIIWPRCLAFSTSVVDDNVLCEEKAKLGSSIASQRSKAGESSWKSSSRTIELIGYRVSFVSPLQSPLRKSQSIIGKFWVSAVAGSLRITGKRLCFRCISIDTSTDDRTAEGKSVGDGQSSKMRTAPGILVES